MTAQQLGNLLPLVLIFVVFYLLILRPARNRQREAMTLQSRLTPGQQIMTTAGLYATVVAVDDDVIVLETAPGVTSRWARAAVSRIVDDPAAERDASARDESGGVGESGTTP